MYSIDLCGFSTGGCIAQVYVATCPERVAGLVLADTFTPELLNRREWLQRSAMLRATVPPVRLVGYKRVEKVMVWLQERFQRGVNGDCENIERFRAEGPKMDTDEFTKVIRAVATFHETTLDLFDDFRPDAGILWEERTGVHSATRPEAG